MLRFSFFFLSAPWTEDDCIKGAYCGLRILSSLLLKSCRAPVLFRSIQRQQLMIKRPENCRPCHSKTNAGTLCIRCGFCPSVCLTPCLFFPFFSPPLAFVCVRARENKSLALVTAQGHTMQCDRYYQIVTKINLESLRLQLTGKVFWIFYEAYLRQSAGRWRRQDYTQELRCRAEKKRKKFSYPCPVY